MFELMLFNSDLVRQRQVDYTETLTRTMRAARGSRRQSRSEALGSAEAEVEARESGQPRIRSAAADCA